MMQGRRRTLGGAPLSIAYGAPASTADYYSQPNADTDDPVGQYPMSWYVVFKYLGAPAADAILFGKNNGETNVNGWRFVITTGGVLTARCGDSIQRVSATHNLSAGNWYIAHGTATAAGSLILYVDGAAIGAPTATGATYATNTANTGICAAGDGGPAMGATVYIAGCGVTYDVMSAGEVATHVAAIKSTLEITAPGASATEWNWDATDADANWADTVQAAETDRQGAGWTYSSEASPTWGA
jgi:hypothetical protein